MSAYTWAKGIAAGAYLVPALMVLAGWLGDDTVLWHWVAPTVAGAFLALTGLFLILDLDRPERFYYIFRYAHWRSWLVKGGLIISVYGLVLMLHFLATVAGRTVWHAWLLPAGIVLAVLTAIYTAYLFAQSKGRDLWQSPVLPVHLAVQAVLAGSAVLAPFAAWLQPETSNALLWTMLASGLAHGALVAGETTVAHATAHAAQAAHEMTGGRYARIFWTSAALVLVAVAAPWLGPAAAIAALAGLGLYEHAYVQAGQSVPLA